MRAGLISEKKRKRRDYRIARKAAFTRPEPGFSLYEGRTRGKKLKYTFDDDEDIFSDGLLSTRRSTRNTSGVSTPAEPEVPRFSASGRQIRTRAGTLYGATLLAGPEEDENAGRPRRTRTSTRANGYMDYSMIDDIGDAPDAGSSSGNEWHGDDEEDDNDDEFDGDEGDAMSDDDSIMDGEGASLVVQLKYGNREARSSLDGPGEGPVSEKPEVDVQGEPESVSDAKLMAPPTQQPLGDGPQAPIRADLVIPDSKGLYISAADNTSAGGSVAAPESTLQNGQNGVV